MTRFLIITTLILFTFSFPFSAMARKPAQKLKDQVKSFKEYDITVEEIMDQGQNAIPDLMELISEKPTKNDLRSVRRGLRAKVTAMNILSELKAKQALKLLKDLLENSDNQSTINNSAKTIGNIGGDKAFRILKKALKKSRKNAYSSLNDERERAVILALGLCGNKKAIPLLRKILNNKKDSLRAQIYAAGSLGLLGVKDGLTIAAKGLNSLDPSLNIAATRALGAIGDGSSVETLKHLTHPYISIYQRKAATVAIAQIEAEQLSDDQKADYIEVKLEKHPESTEFIQWGTRKLKRIKTQRSKKILEKLSKRHGSNKSSLRHAAKMRLKTMD